MCCPTSRLENTMAKTPPANQPKPMTKPDAARIQSGAAKKGDGGVPKGSFASRAQSVADKSKK